MSSESSGNNTDSNNGGREANSSISMTGAGSDNNVHNRKTHSGLKKIVRAIGIGVAIGIPYTVGVSWILCHPIISVVTGQWKCRGVYIDEHQLDPQAYQMDHLPVKYRNANSNTDTEMDANAAYDMSLIDTILEQAKGKNDDYTQFNFDVCSILNDIQNYSNTSDGENSHNNNNATARQKRLMLKLAETLSSQSISCHSSTSSTFQVLKIDPKKAPTSPLEALVFVVPPILTDSSTNITSNDNNNDLDDMVLQKAILFMVARIVEHSSSYLAKTLLFVFSTTKDKHSTINSALEQTVDDLFASFATTPKLYNQSPTSFDYTKYLIRQLIVLDIQTTPTISSQQASFNIIPHGSNGQLPNLDFLTAAIFSYQNIFTLQQAIKPQQSSSKSKMHQLNTRGNMKAFVNDAIHFHSYSKFTSWWDTHIVSQYFPNDNWWQEYGSGLGYMFSFMTQAIFRPAPHSKALNNGIDSITIQVKLSTKKQIDKITIRNKVNTILYGVEYLLRGLSSLQELLHHNVNQYIMVSTMKFVSFDEYIIPIILILLPLALRVLMILFHHEKCNGDDEDDGVSKKNKDTNCEGARKTSQLHFQFVQAFKTVSGSVFLSIILLVMNTLVSTDTDSDDIVVDNSSAQTILNFTFCISYVLILQIVIGSSSSGTKTKRGEAATSISIPNKTTITPTSTILKQKSDEKQSIQVVSCLMGLYIHVPIALVHVSLALISALVWVPLLAFPTYKYTNCTGSKRITLKTMLLKILVILMLPPIAKNILIHILSLAMKVENSTIHLVADSFVSDAISTLKDMNPLSSLYFIAVYVPLHFMLSAICFR